MRCAFCSDGAGRCDRGTVRLKRELLIQKNNDWLSDPRRQEQKANRISTRIKRNRPYIRHGEERKELFKKILLLAVDAEKEYYECEECSYWNVSERKDLYKPKNVDKILKQEYGDKTVEDLGEASYLMGYDLKHNYELIQKYDHRCPKCKGHMKKGNIKNVCCPRCGTKNKPLENVMWD